MANINIRIDDNLKKDAENLFNDLGLNMTTATTMFLKQCRAIADLDAGNGKAHELIEVEDE